MSSNLPVPLWGLREFNDLLSSLRTAIVQIIVDDMCDRLRPVRSGGHNFGEECRGQFRQIWLTVVELVEEGQAIGQRGAACVQVSDLQGNSS
jgi:hypothetical protein